MLNASGHSGAPTRANSAVILSTTAPQRCFGALPAPSEALAASSSCGADTTDLPAAAADASRHAALSEPLLLGEASHRPNAFAADFGLLGHAVLLGALAFGQRTLQHQCLASAVGYLGTGVAHGGFLLLLQHLGGHKSAAPWAVLAALTGLEAALSALARVQLTRHVGAADQLSPVVQRQLWRLMTATTGAAVMQNAALAAAAWGLSAHRGPIVVVAAMAVVARIGEAGTAGMLQALGAEKVIALLPSPARTISPRQQLMVACAQSMWASLGANLPALAGLLAAYNLTGVAGVVLSAVIGTMSLAAALSTLPTLLALAQLQGGLGAQKWVGVGPDEAPVNTA